MDPDLIDALDDPFKQDDEDEVAAIALPDAPPFRITKGKYKGLVLPRMIGVKPSYLDKVVALRREIERDPDYAQHASVLASAYADLRREAEEATAALSEIKLRLAAVMLMMIDQFEVEGDISTLGLANGDSVRVHHEPHLIVEDKEQFRLWCIEQRLERDMVLPWAKANKLLKEMKLAGEPNPPGGQCYARPKVTFSKGEK